MRPRVVAAIAALALSVAGCSERVGHGWDWERMRKQPRYEAYGASRFFADGKAMRTPPAGTIARDASSATEFANLAAAPAPDFVAHGQLRFHVFCAVCHGDHGDGVSVVASNMDPPKPPSLLVAPARLLTAAQLDDVIVFGFGHMPPYAASLSERDQWAIVAYVRSVLQGTPATTDSASKVPQ